MKHPLSTAAAIAFVVLTAPRARADESPTPALPVPATGAGAEAPAPPPAGRGVAFGLEQGLFGRTYEQGLKVRLPLGEHWGVHLRGLSAFGEFGGETNWHVGGRAELIGQSRVFLNLFRLYGGGGPEVTARAAGSLGDKTSIGGGGQFGFEFFHHPNMSFYLEIGGHSGSEVTAGGTAIAGMMFYPFGGR